MEITKYTKKDGSTAYMFKGYIGIDPITSKKIYTTRRGFKTKKDARLEYAKLKTSINENKYINNSNIKFSELYALWLEQYKTTVKASTYYTNKSYIDMNILEHFKDIPVKKITIAYCQNVINKWEHLKSTNRLYGYLKRILTYAVELQIINKVPLASFSRPMQKENIKDITTLFYTKDELSTYLSFYHDDIKHLALFRLLAFSGMRIGELRALLWSDIDFNKKQVKIYKTVAFTEKGNAMQSTKTQSSNRVITLDDATLGILKKWRLEQKKQLFALGYNANSDSQLVFSNVYNCVLSNQSVRFVNDATCKKHNFKRITLHGFRHTHCSLLLDSGASLQSVQKRLGHNNIQITMEIYTHITNEKQLETVDNFIQYMNN